MSGITKQRPSAIGWGVGESAVALVGLAWIALAALWAVPGVMTLDGFVYRAMVDAFARNGSLFVENGLDRYDSGALHLSLMREAGGRLAPQYPGGWGIVAAPAYLAGGVRGVILLNAVASALTLPLLWQAARALFGDAALATRAALIWALATFAVDYALGFWPHAVTAFLVTAAVAAVATGWRGTERAELRGALVAGLALGLGLNIRVDALIAAVPLAVWLLAAGRRPYAAFGLLLAGLAPGLAAAAAINQAKFGIPSPVTYGASGGATSLGHYAALAPLAAAGAAVSLALGLPRIRAALLRPGVLAAGAAAVLVLGLALPATREALIRIAAGAWALVVDFQALDLPSRGVSEMPDGTLRAYGLVKKALLESLPYAAAVIVLVPLLRRGPGRAPVAFCTLFVGLYLVPFAFVSWHGGMANNMRYFLNVLPVLAILAAAAMGEVARFAGGRPAVAAGAVLGVGGASLLYTAARGHPFEFAFQHTVPLAAAGATAALAALVILTRGALRGTLATALRGLVAYGLMLAFLSGWVLDVQVSRQLRMRNTVMDALTADLPRDALLVAYAPAAAGFRLNRPPALTAGTERSEHAVYPPLRELVERAFAEGRPVFVQGPYVAERMVESGVARAFAPRYDVTERYGYDAKFEIYEMTPPAPGEGRRPVTLR